MTETHYTPQWKDKDSNVVIFPAPNTLFEEKSDAHDWQLGQSLFFVPFGLSPAGILEFQAKDGKTEIPHVPARLGKLGECCIVSGPAFDDAQRSPAHE